VQDLTDEERITGCGLSELGKLLHTVGSQLGQLGPARLAPSGVGVSAEDMADYCNKMAGQLAGAAEAAAQAVAPAGAGAQHAASDSAELAVRRARALALRSCANPRCSNLGGASEAALRGRKCGGCHVVRYCGEACCRADWQAHRRACKLLQKELGSGA
jgi:hypothetical protein